MRRHKNRVQTNWAALICVVPGATNTALLHLFCLCFFVFVTFALCCHFLGQNYWNFVQTTLKDDVAHTTALIFLKFGNKIALLSCHCLTKHLSSLNKKVGLVYLCSCDIFFSTKCFLTKTFWVCYVYFFKIKTIQWNEGMSLQKHDSIYFFWMNQVNGDPWVPYGMAVKCALIENFSDNEAALSTQSSFKGTDSCIHTSRCITEVWLELDEELQPTKCLLGIT